MTVSMAFEAKRKAEIEAGRARFLERTYQEGKRLTPEVEARLAAADEEIRQDERRREEVLSNTVQTHAGVDYTMKEEVKADGLRVELEEVKIAPPPQAEEVIIETKVGRKKRTEETLGKSTSELVDEILSNG